MASLLREISEPLIKAVLPGIVLVPIVVSPLTWRVEPGETVPIPTFPELAINNVLVALALPLESPAQMYPCVRSIDDGSRLKVEVATVSAPLESERPTPVKSVKYSDPKSRFVNERLGSVEVAVVEVAVKYSDTVCPTTDNAAYGEEVPMPRFPPEVNTSSWLPVSVIMHSCYLPLP